ncbi:hypothetical protein B9Z19DRAFT_1124891 [Tuber borchii]|uniref:Uncharacterized protein n=1 Tax=Tuber borchii TaxID=42251 RepID=A0A2T6ZVW9_TUBBO|nr:hypothetical protein B9Z19DRAFT_1124891 [Tuber borchii]
MPPNSPFPTRGLLGQLNKRDQIGDKGAGSSDNNSPVVMAGLVIAALTLLVAILAYQHERFRHSLSSLLPWYFFFYKHVRRIRRTIPLSHISNTIPAPDSPGTGYVFIHNDYSKAGVVFIYNNYPNAEFAEFAGGDSSFTSSQSDTASRGDMRRHRTTATATAARPSLAAPPIRLVGVNTNTNTVPLLIPNV